jgi:hypothetical protein
MAFIFYAIVLIGLGILVRIFWVPLMMIGLVLGTLASIAICSAVMSLFCQIVKACSTGNWFDEDFTTFFWYSAIPIGICFVLRFLITLDILSVASGWGTKIGNLFVYFKTKK